MFATFQARAIVLNMEHFELREAQLFRILSGVFGKDRVIPRVGIGTVCGGEMPDLPPARYPNYEAWAKDFRCLFTIVNHEDDPCMVVEFFNGFSVAVDPREAEREHYLPSVLKCRNIHYITLSHEEFDEILAPENDFSFLQLVECKIGDEVLA